MCENPSPAHSHNPAITNPQGSSSHAGFTSANTLGTGVSSTGPRLAGWPRQIAWNEFREVNQHPGGVDENAQIYVQLAPGNLRTVREGGQYRLGDMEMHMTVLRAQSWVVAGHKTSALLAHEQGHFDITGLVYRRMLPELRAVREHSLRRLANEVRRILRKYNIESQRLSDLYDSKPETDHGRNTQRQQAWETLIRNCMQNNTPLTAAPP
jgi:hypothetical protein